MDRNFDLYLSLYVDNFDMLYGNAENMDDTEKDRMMQYVERKQQEQFCKNREEELQCMIM